MLILIVFGLVLSVTSHVESTYKSDYDYYPEAGGWLKLHSVSASWKEAFMQCRTEGAVLASPLTSELRGIMQNKIEDNHHSIPHFIGANSQFSPGHYVSIEGVPITHMPTTDMYEVLDKKNGDCLSMNDTHIKVVSCSNPLPYLCYKKNLKCGTPDTEYRLEPKTGSCYKVHRELREWSEASSVCISEGGHLAIINNEVEARILTNLIPAMAVTWSINRDWQGLFIGVQDWDKATWLTIHAEPLSELFNTWDDGQPDSPGASNCGVINRRGKLDNIRCTFLAPFVCEKDPKNVRYSQEQPDQIGSLVPLPNNK